MQKYDRGQIEQKQYPKDLAIPFGVSSGIWAKRCQGCDGIFFTNDNDFKRCRYCKNSGNVKTNTK